MKYRKILVDCCQYCGVYLETWVIQVKKWYGWVTFYTGEGECSEIRPEIDKILEALK